MGDFPDVHLVAADGHEVSGETNFGGRPQSIQARNTPECCGRPMAPLVQVDGLDFPEAGLPDGALAYLYVCRQCASTWSPFRNTRSATCSGTTTTGAG